MESMTITNPLWPHIMKTHDKMRSERGEILEPIRTCTRCRKKFPKSKLTTYKTPLGRRELIVCFECQKIYLTKQGVRYGRYSDHRACHKCKEIVHIKDTVTLKYGLRSISKFCKKCAEEKKEYWDNRGTEYCEVKR
jgi:hypothetical protein